MRRLLFVIIIAALGWSGYWFYGAYVLRTQITAYFESQTNQGWQAELGAIKVQGFPNRFDTVFSDVEITDTDGQVHFKTPRMESYMLSYNWKNRIFAFPAELVLATPDRKFRTLQDQLRLSLALKDLRQHEVERIIVEGENLQILENDAHFARVRSVNFALEADENSSNLYRLGLNLGGLVLADQNPALGRENKVFIDAYLTFDTPLDQRIWQRQRPQIIQVDLKQIDGVLGPAEFQVAGAFDIDPQGVPDGEITVRITNWKVLLEDMIDGFFEDDTTGSTKTIIGAAEFFFGKGEDLDIPIRLREGKMYFGMLPIGDAPILRLP